MISSNQGLSPERYRLIPRTLVFITSGEHVLLLKGAENKRLWANQYNGVGGHVERGEDVLSAAQRELMEEAQLEPENLWLCGVITIDTCKETGIGIYVFRGEIEDMPSEIKSSVEGALEWIPFDQIHKKPLVEDLHQLLPLVLAKKKKDPPFVAQYHYQPSGQLVITINT